MNTVCIAVYVVRTPIHIVGKAIYIIEISMSDGVSHSIQYIVASMVDISILACFLCRSGGLAGKATMIFHELLFLCE